MSCTNTAEKYLDCPTVRKKAATNSLVVRTTPGGRVQEIVPVTRYMKTRGTGVRTVAYEELDKDGLDVVKAAVKRRRARDASRPAWAVRDPLQRSDSATPEDTRRKRWSRRVKQPFTKIVRSTLRQASGKWVDPQNKVWLHMAREQPPIAQAESFNIWSSNGKWKGTDVTFRFYISPTWERDVLGVEGLATAAGTVTLAAQEIEPPDTKSRMWQATWAQQSRGLSVRTFEGFIIQKADGSWRHIRQQELKREEGEVVRIPA